MNKLIVVLLCRKAGLQRDVGRVRGNEHTARRRQLLGTLFRHEPGLESKARSIGSIAIAVVLAPQVRLLMPPAGLTQVIGATDRRAFVRAVPLPPVAARAQVKKPATFGAVA
jgi:hypothetical protein